MRRILLVSLLAVAAACFVQAQGTGGSEAEKLKQEVIKFEDEHTQAVKQRDTAALDRIFADDIVWVPPSGDLLPKSQVLAENRSGKLNMATIEHRDFHFDIYGNTVVVTGLSTSRIEYGDKVSYGPRRFVNVYVKQDGRWQIVVHTVTDVKSDAPR
jgi:ketosteroid isomerase-like protein